ncbi:hypothetical protein SDC9_129869 [bioreactor metagenome]|uniref:Uncharacterized protein n=1 Tax=bioreactor metagenome TaxID=1076179 RepID=A0A645D0U6_9ZZZZ
MKHKSQVSPAALHWQQEPTGHCPTGQAEVTYGEAASREVWNIPLEKRMHNTWDQTFGNTKPILWMERIHILQPYGTTGTEASGMPT